MSQPSAPKQTLPPLQIEAGGPTPEIKQANLEAILPSPGYPSLAIMLADAITKRVDIILLDYTPSSTNIRYKVDGVWHTMAPMERQAGDFMLATLKRLANQEHLERVRRQEGEFVVMYVKRKHKCRMISQGVPTGERVAIYIDRKYPSMENLEQLGMRERQRSQLADVINQDRSLVLAGALPDDFYDVYWKAVLSAGDRFMRDYALLHEKKERPGEVINVTPFPYSSETPDGLSKAIYGLLLREPNVVAFNSVPDGKTLDEACKLVNQNDLTVITRTPARDVFDAILRVLVLEPNVEKFAQALTCVVVQRNLRLLCEYCKLPFQPNPQLLTQLGLPTNRVTTFYTHFRPKPEDLVDEKGNPIDWEPCPKCGGPGYFERTCIFELLMVNDPIREAIIRTPTRQALVDAAAKTDFIPMRDEGVLKVAKGLTSLEELRRALKL
ncbi:MAG TPA: ATPase, T2SS/T4P/T4SS family [Pirellulaceae bacterium]|nr:ATPase, T2SS/T4P/T4SS family [Pirellulaceae bacterium]HMO92944.1 ATPase, T2SS/T4P/T4SS family [Pirellulaceae bacterium]HMP68491.1 ATPase, T2SS/T4P/T4SS family [Pirellulaceae bacterium]